jgi:hypothetical protein
VGAEMCNRHSFNTIFFIVALVIYSIYIIIYICKNV